MYLFVWRAKFNDVCLNSAVVKLMETREEMAREWVRDVYESL